MAAEAAAKRTWGQAFAVYFERPVLSMLFLGFSAGLPFFLVFSTLSAWLRTAHIERATIGMLAWVGLMYSFKWIWAPIVDRVGLPMLDRLLGRRRSWMLVAQARADVLSRESRARQSRRERRVHGRVRARRRILLGHAGHRHRRLAHRIRHRGQAGRDGGGLPDRLSHRPDGGLRGRTHHCRRVGLPHQLLHDGGAGADRVSRPHSL